MTAERAAALLAQSRSVVVLTGAGISTESGLPDFRSPRGIWAEWDPMEVATLSAFRATPHRFFDFYRTRLATLTKARPNAAHVALTRLEEQGRVRVVITQNVDGLHQAAGSQRVIELHGNLREAICDRCGTVGPIAAITEALEAGRLPQCHACRGALKPNVVLFEEPLPESVYRDAETACRGADLLLVVGSSLQVTPAAWLPEVALRHGAAMIIVNAEPTPLDHVASVVIRGRAGVILPALVHGIDGSGQKDSSR